MSGLLARLAAWLDSRPEREQHMLRLGALLGLLIVIGGGLLALDRTLAAAHERVTRKQQELAFTQAAAAEILAAGPVRNSTAGGSSEPLLVVAERLASEAGLREALTSTESTSEGSLRASFRDVSFDVLVGMVFRLSDQHGISVREASMQSTSQPGRVNATLVLNSTASPALP